MQAGEPDGHWHERLSWALCGVLLRGEAVAERAPGPCQLIIEGMRGVLQDSVQLLSHPPLRQED